MKKILIAGIAMAGVAICGGASAAVDAAKAKQLAQKYNCLACHAVDKKLVGPAYEEVAKKYKGDKGAEAKLVAKVKSGGSGVWGAIPMPPNNVPDPDVQTMVEWILSLQ
ncbi:MAG TPA: c-type cytochrome [Burkholderiales bacterium]|nr:c-type cytochrome [Burkholderiales bacterium]